MVSTAPNTSRNLAGAILSRRWRLARKLGEGGMGEVYSAEPVEGGPRVAVKVLRAEFLGQSEVLARFLDEARTCMRLIHPNIVRMHECAGAEDGSPYMVMELLDGVPLGAYTQNGGQVPLAQAVPILQGILAGLAAAHAQGVIHRDLKPDNVFLTRAPDGTFVVKVLDFGIAKVMDEAGGMGSRTRTGMLLGTPAYMSPEQVKDPRDVDPRSDLWSAGVMFYEMLTGRVAFPAPTAYARMAAVLSIDPPPVETLDPTLASFSGFVSRSLKKNRTERFGSALEMARALAAAAPTGMTRSDGRVGVPATPLTVLPGLSELSSMFAPPVAGQTSPLAHGSGARAAGQERREADQEQREDASPTHAPGGTLASPGLRPLEIGSGRERSDGPAVIVLGQRPGAGETLPSKELPVLGGKAAAGREGKGEARPGVAPAVVAILVAVALSAGFLLGWVLRVRPFP